VLFFGPQQLADLILRGLGDHGATAGGDVFDGLQRAFTDLTSFSPATPPGARQPGRDGLSRALRLPARTRRGGAAATPAAGAFEQARRSSFDERSETDETLRAALDEGRISDFLRLAVRARKNIIVSGGTSTGKTTFLNALMKEIPAHERLILIEDTPEVKLGHANAIGLVAVRGALGESGVTVDDLLQASLRMRPDRIILGELRGAEAFSFLRAVSSGHPGSITTVHADSPRAAVDQIALMVLQAGANLGRAEITDYVGGVVDVAVQLARRSGRRLVSEVSFKSRAPADGLCRHCQAIVASG